MSAVAVGYLDAQDFASRLDRAIHASERAKLIEARAIEVEDHGIAQFRGVNPKYRFVTRNADVVGERS